MNNETNIQLVETSPVYGKMGMTSHAVPRMEMVPNSTQLQYANVSPYASKSNMGPQESFSVCMGRENSLSVNINSSNLSETVSTSFNLEQENHISTHNSSGMQYSNEMEGDNTEEQIMTNCPEQAYQGMGEDEVDRRSVFVGNVDYGTTPVELQEHFKVCGSINRITIMVDRYTGHPKGYAYIEFQDESAVTQAVMLSDSIFRDRPLKVTPKRKNIPGFSGLMMGRGGRGAPFGAAPFRGRFGKAYLSPFGPRGRRGMCGPPGYFPRYRGRSQRPYGPY